MEPHTLRTQSQTKEIEDFFSEYEKSFNLGIAGDLDTSKETIRNSFAPCFIESSPAGIICGHNDKDFWKKIEQGFGFYQNIGSTSMKIISQKNNPIDDLHTMATIDWRYTALKDNKEIVIDFTNIYFLNLADNGIRIFAYIAGDEQKALKEKGLV